MRLRLTVLALALSGCAHTAPPDAASLGGALGLSWTAVDSLAARLPGEVGVYAGVSTSDTLRAWAVRLPAGTPLDVAPAADPTDGREVTTAIAERTGACVALNGGYFNMETGVPVGLVIRGGRVEAPPTLGATRDEVRYPVRRGALALGPGGAEIAWVGGGDAAACRSDGPVPNRPGAPGRAPTCRPWDVETAIAAAPVLVRDGRAAVATEAEVFWGSHANRHPRSAVGLAADGAVWLVVVDGRQPLSRGVTLEELAEILLGLGAADALNLDGGGSSTLVVRPPGGPAVRLNLPTGYDVQREVANAVTATCLD